MDGLRLPDGLREADDDLDALAEGLLDAEADRD